jgi:hypothetical protein
MSDSVNGTAPDGGGDSKSVMTVAALESVDALTAGFVKGSRERMRVAKVPKTRAVIGDASSRQWERPL